MMPGLFYIRHIGLHICMGDRRYGKQLKSPVKLNFDLEQIATEFTLMACDSTWVST